MLFTRCPECDTTFRVTDETLKKANGQVRCGRCASVFNAYAELHDPAARERSSLKPRNRRAASEAAAPAAAPPPPAPPPAAAAQTDATIARARPPNRDRPPLPSIGAASVADVVAEVDLAAAERSAGGRLTRAALRTLRRRLSATDDRARARPRTRGRPFRSPPTCGLRSARQPARVDAASRWWSVAAAVALLALGAQAIHHFRVGHREPPDVRPVGRSKRTARSAARSRRTGTCTSIEILDWVATAEPNSRGLGSLKITARIQNRGPLRQPYPAVQLRLKDRWEEAVGSRMFTPAEYLPRDTPRGRLMSPGETARAEIEVVDPGPDAYGFELDVCIEVEAYVVTCGTDKVFL